MIPWKIRDDIDICNDSGVIVFADKQFENTFLRFFENPKNATFYVFLKRHFKKT